MVRLSFSWHRSGSRCTQPNLLVDVLDKLGFFFPPLRLPRGGQSEVGLAVDVVEACSGHQQFSSPQLHVLQEGQTSVALPLPDSLPQVAPAAARDCNSKDTHPESQLYNI